MDPTEIIIKGSVKKTPTKKAVGEKTPTTKAATKKATVKKAPTTKASAKRIGTKTDVIPRGTRRWKPRFTLDSGGALGDMSKV